MGRHSSMKVDPLFFGTDLLDELSPRAWANSYKRTLKQNSSYILANSNLIRFQLLLSYSSLTKILKLQRQKNVSTEAQP